MPGAQRLRVAALGLASALHAAAAAAAPTPADVPGAWDVALENSHRRCRIVFAADEEAGGRVLRVPATCRRALPILREAGFWAAEAGALHVLDRERRAILRFGPEEEGARLARTDTGESYRLEQKERLVVRASLPPKPPPLVPQRTWIAPDAAPKPETLPGTYHIDRYQERETCRVALTPVMLTAAGAARYEARVLEGCRDAGLAAFDPVSWHYEAGRLTLTARRGHEVGMVSERPGEWRRDPEVGSTLILRRAAGP